MESLDFVILLEKELKEWIGDSKPVDVRRIDSQNIAIIETIHNPDYRRVVDMAECYNYVWVNAGGRCEFYAMGRTCATKVISVDWHDPGSFDQLRAFLGECLGCFPEWKSCARVK